eukprot:2719828-Amphidinium_carterae.3
MHQVLAWLTGELVALPLKLEHKLVGQLTIDLEGPKRKCELGCKIQLTILLDAEGSLDATWSEVQQEFKACLAESRTDRAL